MDVIRLRDKLQRLPGSVRTQLISDTLVWLTTTESAKCRPEHLPFLQTFEKELQQLLGAASVPTDWTLRMAQTFGSFPFFETFVRKTL